MVPQEARLHSRAPFVQKVSVIPSGATTPLRLWTSNLSEGGLCLQTAQPFRRGDRVSVRMDCEGTEICVPVAEVSWVLRDVRGSSRTPGVGLRFVSIDPADRRLIRQFVGSLGEASNADTLPPLPHKATAAFINNLPSQLPPPGDAISIHPRDSEIHEVGDSDMEESQEPSLGPLPVDQAEAGGWEFSEGGSGDSIIAASQKRSGWGFAAALLAVGTLTGMIFGVLNQSGKTVPPKQVAVAAAPEPANPDPPAAEETPVIDEAPESAPQVATPAPRPVPSAPAVRAPVTAQSNPKTASPAPSKPAAPRPQPKEVRAAPATGLVADLSPASRKPGTVSLGAISVRGQDMVVPIKGARGVERHFVLQNPPRVVLDLIADAYDGPRELPGKGAISRVRVGERPGAVRVVLEVKNPNLARSYRLVGAAGNYSVTVASR